jgi:hypothetical protein
MYTVAVRKNFHEKDLKKIQITLTTINIKYKKISL